MNTRCLQTPQVKMSIFATMRWIVNLFILFFSLLSVSASAQTTDEQLAAQYFANKEYDKAADLYEKLLSKSPSAGYYYENLLEAYLNNKRFDEAVKLTRKQQKRFPGQIGYEVDEGYVYAKQTQTAKAIKLWDELLNKRTNETEQASSLSMAFQKRGELDRAIEAMLRARKKQNNPYLFCIQLAPLYADTKKTDLMIAEYLNALEVDAQLMEDVQGFLQAFLQYPAEFDFLKQGLLKKYKANTNNPVFSEMIIWMYVQRKEFGNAFLQAKVFDKRYKEDGSRIYQLANLAIQNQAFDDAIQMFTYIINLGQDGGQYMNAKMGMMDAKRQKIMLASNPSTAELQSLDADYNTFLASFGRSYITASVMRNQAQLQAYYLHQTEHAITLFQEIIQLPRLDRKMAADCKLELGDVYTMHGEPWEAMLLYGQVDKDFNEDPLGQEAKFRNARLSYYLGEFEWARAQLEVLKTATSQLIANNALELSLLIQDNTVDSNEQPMQWFAKADLYYFQQQPIRATQWLDSIAMNYPRHALSDDVLLKRAQIAQQQRQYDQAVSYLQQLLKEHGSDILGDNALFLLADITQNQLKDADAAKKLYERLLQEYPGSFFTTEARKRYRTLRGDALK